MARIKTITPVVVGMALLAGLAGGTLINSIVANAATDSSTNTATTTADSTLAAEDTTPARDESQGGHTANGKTEELLTGDTAAKAKAAAEAAVSGGTVLRVETDAEGAAYEAHVRKSDGTQVTVKLDGNFKVTSIENGPDGHGGRPDDDDTSTST